MLMEDAALTAGQVAHFNDHGYLTPLTAVSPAQAREFRERLEMIEAKLGREAEGYLKIKAHLASPWMTDLARHPRIVSAVQSVLGPDLLLTGSSFFAKNARDPRFVSWHQDAAYFGLSENAQVTAWVAFTPSTVQSGCVRVLPGSHLGENMRHEERISKDNLLARGQTIVDIDESRAVSMELQPGQFSLHHVKTAHCSHANQSDDRRIGLAFFYMPTRVASIRGRRSAMLVSGVDEYNHWDPDPMPRCDLDPVCVAELDRVWGNYTKGAYRLT
ncbi:phytanoyl-CoA dioxygenase family protein [Pigmentiphaga soli]|uniref:Phytanoyl-CoA dioxygenase family protein n=2 Tax=Pigmentiphaga soli TaxID=1007095 RepID=A0ABP8H0V3_9BURK